MGLRDRREERRDEREAFGRGGSASRFQMRQKMVAIGDDFWVEDEAGDRVFHVDGKAMRLRNTLDFEDAQGTKLCRIQTRALHIRDTMEIEDPDGNRLAVVHKALISPLRERWKVDLADGAGVDGAGHPSRTTSTRSRRTDARSPRSRSSGSASATPTASRSSPVRTWRSCWPSRSPSTR